ncbi:prolyl oligopeptidase family protein [Bacteroidota bacterium]
MKSKIILIGVLLILIHSSCKKKFYNYPYTKKVNQVDNYFGTEISDPYRWLEDENSDEVNEWITRQNDFTFNYLSQIPFREQLKNELTDLYDFEKSSAPVLKGGYYFMLKNDGLQNQDVLYIMENLSSNPQILLDPNKLSDDGTIALTDYSVSKDGKYLAYALSKAGSDWNEIHVMDIKSKKKLGDHIRWVKFSKIAWYSSGFYYSRFDEPKEGGELSKTNFSHKVFYHEIGTSQEQDELIFQNTRFPNRTFRAYLTSDKKYLIVSEQESTHGNSIYVKNLETPTEDFTKLTTSFDYEYYVIDHINDNLLILTNYRAPKYSLIKIDVNSFDIGNWKDLISEKNIVLENVEIADNKIVTTYIEDAYSKVEIYDLQGKFLHQIDLPPYVNLLEFHGDLESDVAFYSFTSFLSPVSVYKYNFKTNESEVYFKPELNINTDDFETNQVFFKSKDGTKIPMFLVHKKGIQFNGKNPALLYGYGGFNISILANFKARRLLWLDKGGVFASANIRGGGEYGENWHLAGKEFNKQNVFNDFIYAAQYLIEEGYTSPDYLAIHGASNGGLLVGAVTNQRPDLFKVALPAVGVMDMLRFHKFTIGWAWTGDYGSSEDSAHFENLYTYSPLHNITDKKNYPSVLVMTADHDDRVVPAHSFKYIATLQEKYNGKNPVLIRIQTKAGHGKGKPTHLRIEEDADMIAFTLFNMGISPEF